MMLIYVRPGGSFLGAIERDPEDHVQTLTITMMLGPAVPPRWVDELQEMQTAEPQVVHFERLCPGSRRWWVDVSQQHLVQHCVGYRSAPRDFPRHGSLFMIRRHAEFPLDCYWCAINQCPRQGQRARLEAPIWQRPEIQALVQGVDGPLLDGSQPPQVQERPSIAVTRPKKRKERFEDWLKRTAALIEERKREHT